MSAGAGLECCPRWSRHLAAAARYLSVNCVTAGFDICHFRFDANMMGTGVDPQDAMSGAVANHMEFIDLKAQYRALRSSIDAHITRVLEHGQYVLGPEVAELETQLASFTGAHHCVSVASGTEALLIALMALGIGPGDEVVTTPFTFIASVEVIVLVGARPVLVDVEPDTGNMDASKLEAALTDRTRAIMPVSLYGQPADMDAINAIASARGSRS